MSEDVKRNRRQSNSTQRGENAGGDSSFEPLRVHPDERSLKWRFHRGVDDKWRWQKMSADNTVIADSGSGFETYEQCVRDAAAAGYRDPPAPRGLSELRDQ